MRGVYREIIRPDRIVSTEQFDESWYPGGAVGTAVFTERGIYRPGERVYAKAILRDGALGALRVPAAQNKAFVERGQLKMVLTVLIPTAIYATLVTWIGIYVSSVLFIGFFMRWLGKYPWWKVALVSVTTVVVFYFIFEVWFKVPLPKGPLETLLGIN